MDAFPDLSNKEFAKEHNYVDNLPWVSYSLLTLKICFPEGYSFKAYNKSKDEGELSQMKMFHFIITNQDGKKQYITTITFKVMFLSFKYSLGVILVWETWSLHCSKIYLRGLLQANLLSLKVSYNQANLPKC